MLLEVFDRVTMRKIATLENAFNIEEDQRINAVWYLDFDLPFDDPKNDYCQLFNYIKIAGGDQLYRIVPADEEESETGSVKYECEHVIATLMDTVLDGYHIIGNLGYYTDDCIRYVLNKQNVKHWKLGQCDFKRQFEYGLEDENLLSALFSIPKPFKESCMWTYDTSTYPWTLNLERVETSGIPELYIRYGKNLLKPHKKSDSKNLCTRLYCYGYGEGVNRLDVADVNGGCKYLQSPPDIVAKYGIIERTWIDRRYENPESLKAAGEAMLADLQESVEEYDIEFDELEGLDIDTAALGKRVEIITASGKKYRTWITEIKRKYDEITTSQIRFSTRPRTIGQTVADMADRQRIEMTYSQGATQLYAQSLQANADTSTGASLNFFIPREMRIVNKVLVKIKVERFRAYSMATETRERQARTTSYEGGSRSSTGSGGGDYTSTSYRSEEQRTTLNYEMGGGSLRTLNDNAYYFGTHNHGIPAQTRLAVTHDGETVSGSYGWVPSGAHHHGVHAHYFSVPGHSHTVTVPNHTHSFEIGNHSHSIEIPAHSHRIDPGIYRFGSPSGFTLKVNNRQVATYAQTSAELDITGMLVGGNTKSIPRGSWLSVEIVPNDLAYISIDLMLQGFVQSRGDHTL